MFIELRPGYCPRVDPISLSFGRAVGHVLLLFSTSCMIGPSVKPGTATDTGSILDSGEPEPFPACALYSGFLGLGTSWSYVAVEGHGKLTAEITAFSGRDVTRFEHREIIDGADYYDLREGEYQYRCEDDGLYLMSSYTEWVHAGGGFEQSIWLDTSYYHPVLIMPAELEIGDSFDQVWSSNFYGSDGSVGSTYTATSYDVAEEEEIEVAAGTYSALRLKESRTESTWVVDGVGFVLDSQWELVSFDE